MSKTFISNNKSFCEEVRRDSVTVGFTNFSEKVGCNYSIVSFKKLNFENDDFIDFDTGFISVSGTFIYKGKVGIEGLNLIYSEFDGDVGKLRSKLIGNYFFVIGKYGEKYIFGDDNNIFNIYYYHQDGTWIVSNNVLDIVSQLKCEVEINEFDFIEHVFQNAILDDRTIYTGVNKLKGDAYIIISDKTNDFELKTVGLSLIENNIEIEDSVDELSNKLKKYASIIKSSFDPITISMTGGLDSRVVLASYLSVGVKPNLVYGVGNSSLTNTHRRDLEINHIYRDKFGLSFFQMDWKTSSPIDEYWGFYARKYGLLSTIYGASHKVNSSLESLPNTEFIDFGYFGEPLRNIAWVENMTDEFFTLSDYLDDFYINKSLSLFYNEDKYIEFREHLYEKLNSICVRNNLSPEKLHKNDFQKLHNEYRKGADTLLLNLVNYNCYSINLLSLKEIESYVACIGYKEKNESKFILNTLNVINKDILDVPVFSHRDTYSVDKKRMSLVRSKKTHIKEAVKSIALKINPTGRLLTKVKDVFKVVESEKISDDMIKQKIISEIRGSNIGYINLDDYCGDVRCLAKYAQIIKMTENILK